MSKTGSSVWYAAYGSNLLSSRFMAYINGGDLAGSRRGHRGARDRTPPSDWLTYTFDPRYYLCFAGESTRWTGGVCFLGSEESAAEQQARRPVLGRAWLINESQLVDVWSQESMSDANDLERAMVEGAFDPSVAGAQIDVGTKWYNRLQVVGAIEGAPVVTITAAEIPNLNLAAEPYLKVVAEGLQQTWNMTADEADAYLAVFNRVPPN